MMLCFKKLYQNKPCRDARSMRPNDKALCFKIYPNGRTGRAVLSQRNY